MASSSPDPIEPTPLTLDVAATTHSGIIGWEIAGLKVRVYGIPYGLTPGQYKVKTRGVFEEDGSTILAYDFVNDEAEGETKTLRRI